MKLKEDLKNLTCEVQSASRDCVKCEKHEWASTEFKTEIPRADINKLMNDYDKDLINTIFRDCMIRFDDLINNSIKNMVDSLHNLITVINIENKEEGIITGNDKEASLSAFNAYYSDRIETYFKENSKNYLNPHLFKKKNAYRGLFDKGDVLSCNDWETRQMEVSMTVYAEEERS